MLVFWKLKLFSFFQDGNQPIYTYNSPTFSQTDSDRKAVYNVCPVVEIEISPKLTDRIKLNEIRPEKGDNIKLAFLVAFPVVFFLVAVIIVGTNV